MVLALLAASIVTLALIACLSTILVLGRLGRAIRKSGESEYDEFTRLDNENKQTHEQTEKGKGWK